MNLISFALRKPITILALILAVLFFSVLVIRKMPIDIFPKLNIPTIYISQPYGGLSPEQMEAFITSNYEYFCLYVTGVKSVESKSIQGAALIKLQFHEGTDMSQALSEVVANANRAKSKMPEGTPPPFITRFDAGSVPVGQIVFRSDTRELNEIQDLALFKVRPMFSTLPGVSAPPPLGGNQRTIIIKADPERLRSYGVSPDELVAALSKSNLITPAGNIRIGSQSLVTPQNTIVNNPVELENIPIILKSGPAVYLRDVATVEDGADFTTGYALVNKKRSIYIQVTKRADASTWEVVKNIKKALPDMQAAIPDDIKISYEFDQSGYVINSLRSLLFESGLGAILTGLMVLLFLRDLRSAIIVIITIPLALLFAVVCLYLTGQTINVMTLGGLALAVGILVDEATVTIENIHHHQEAGKMKARAIADACKEIALPKLLILLSILAVFVPSLFMSGLPKAMFLPLSLAVGFAMVASFLLSQTFVPVLCNWILKTPTNHGSHWFDRVKFTHEKLLGRWDKHARWIVPGCVLLFIGIASLSFIYSGKEIFPKVDAGQIQFRLRLPSGTRIERTEEQTQKVLYLIDELAGKKNVAISSAFVGTQPSSFPNNTIYLWTSGPHEALVKVNFDKESGLAINQLKEGIRKAVQEKVSDVQLSFEPADLVDQVMSLGTNTPIELAVVGKNLDDGRAFAGKIKTQLESIPYLRDIQYTTPLDYPTLDIKYDRLKVGQLGLTIKDVSHSIVAGTSSSRFTEPNYWLDSKSGNAYQVQVELPQYLMDSPEQLEQIPVGLADNKNIFLRDVADWNRGTMVGEYDRINQQRYIAVSANIQNKDFGSAMSAVKKAITNAGKLPRGLKVILRGQAELMDQTFGEMGLGLALAIVIIFLVLSANFQSFKQALIILSIIPPVVAGSFLLLILLGKTLNIQSFMGCIMAIGVAISNAILLITNAEQIRKESGDNFAGIVAAQKRLRPILMTSLAMIAGMVPMALGFGEGSEQTAPLGVAVIGGLIFATISTLLFLPLLYRMANQNIQYKNASLDPDDPESKFYDV